MRQTTESLGGLQTLIVRVGQARTVAVVMLHGYAMRPEDLSPFAGSMGAPGVFYLPEAPLKAEIEGRAWWPIDQEQRAAAMVVGPRDLAAEHPAGADAARALLGRFLAEVKRRHPAAPLVLVGFSQGGMLACDIVLRDSPAVAGLALLSTSRICAVEWVPLASRLAELPILVSHGKQDPDLSFHAGEALRDFCQAGGGLTTWVPFDGDHSIPLVVWRALRRFIVGISRSTATP